ncbi:class III poly(R)-hydroxyalkanoic acid synthase subunit PhaE [Rhodanobacter caeni]|uniref:Poly(3-hydroxyalkanoate) polymerase subunit PhaE n=2 Tax=Rhodanobacter caeni TaxID=657654 RepID=A0ABN0U7X3_9GAMM
MAPPADFPMPDFLKAGVDADFLRDFQALAQQSWDAWLRQQPTSTATGGPSFGAAPNAAAGNEVLDRTLAGLKGYFEWMQGVTAGAAGVPGADWQQQLQQLFGGAQHPFAQAFQHIDGAGTKGGGNWHSWLQGMPVADASASGPIPAFGQDREQQMQRQALAAAMLESMQASARYQALILRANTQGVQKLQDKLAEHAEPGRQIESLKALYDLWVDAAEEAYAEIALSDEFREAYGAMANSQMRVRRLQQQQTEQLCQQWGLPTRREMDTLGERLQQVRREVRTSRANQAASAAEEIADLRREVAELRRQLGGAKVKPVSARRSVAKKALAAKPSRLAVKTAETAKPATRRETAAGKSATTAARKTGGKGAAAVRKSSATRSPAPRKRK